jgi:hypothetical protein
MALQFKVIETTASPLWDFGWFDLTQFKIEGPAKDRRDSRAVLGRFLLDPISQRSFCTQPDPWGATVNRHGPFPRERLTVDWYRPIPHEDLERRVMSVLDDPEFTESLSMEQRRPVEAWLREIRGRGADVLVLEAPSSPSARVDWDVWVLFHEFVELNSNRGELTIAVIGYD